MDGIHATDRGEEIRPGDTVFHRPSNQVYRVLGTNKQQDSIWLYSRMVGIDWPDVIEYKLSDCVLVCPGDGLTSGELNFRRGHLFHHQFDDEGGS